MPTERHLCLQDAIWEAEIQAQQLQQHLLQQRMGRRSSLQRCAPSRSISMPSTSQQSTMHLNTDKSGLLATTPHDCSHFAAAVPTDTYDALPTVSEHCGEEHLTDSHLPLIRVPSSLSEVNKSPTASGTALASSSRSNGVRTGGSAGGAYVTPYMPPFGSSSRTGRQQNPLVSPSLQTVLSLAAKVHSPLHASAMHKSGQACRVRAQSSVAATAGMKTGQGLRSGCQSSSGKGKTMGDKGSMSQRSHTKLSHCLER